MKVGDRVKVFLLEDYKFHGGTVERNDSRTRIHTIDCDDGVRKCLNMSEKQYRVLKRKIKQWLAM